MKSRCKTQATVGKSVSGVKAISRHVGSTCYGVVVVSHFDSASKLFSNLDSLERAYYVLTRACIVDFSIRTKLLTH
jgi:hypothetical protein